MVLCRQADLQRLDILINTEPVDALARICHRDKATAVGRRLVAKLRELMDRQQFEVALQASLHGAVVHSELQMALQQAPKCSLCVVLSSVQLLAAPW